MRRRHSRQACFLVAVVAVAASMAGVTRGEGQAAPPVPHWIWIAANEPSTETTTVCFRRVFDAAGPVKQAELVGMADDLVLVYLNGQKLGSIEGAKSFSRIDATGRLVAGKNVLALEGVNAAGPAGVLVRLKVVAENGETAWLASDGDWLARGEEVDGWQSPDFDDSSWHNAASLGRLGAPPWGDPTGEIDDYNQWKQALGGGTTDPTLISAPSGFEVELVRRAGENEGSWISIDFDPRGRLVVAREDKGLLRMTLPEDGTGETQVETINDTLEECRGVLHAFGDLYVNANNSRGFYRLRDADGDDRYEQVELLLKTEGGVGHGRNDLALGPDGLIYLIHGNNVKLPADVNLDGSPLAQWGEDRLLPCSWDRTLFDSDVTAPAGYLLRTDRDGKHWEVVCGGFRNAYGIDFNADGELFTFDSDMEWDIGAPWYRPTRVDHLVSGGDYGYRQGTKVWPADMPDGLPPSLDIGKGSPTGVKFGTRSNFPPPYRRALFILDWAYGRIFAVHLTPRGASYDCRGELFLKGRPLNVTDLDFGPDGAMYFVVGGRRTQSALYRVRYVGPEVADVAPSAEEIARNDEAARARASRRQLAAFHGRPDSRAVETAWPHLASPDLWIRHAARVAIEHQPVDTWRERALAEKRPLAALTALMALARVGSPEDGPRLLNRLMDIPFSNLAADERLVWLRACALTCIRCGRPDAATAARISGQLGAVYPSGSVSVNRDLCELLVYLEWPEVVERTMPLILAAKTQEERLHYLFTLRHVKTGWSPAARRTYFQWLARSEAFAGAHYMPLFLHHIRDDALLTCSDDERKALAPVLAAAERPAAPSATTKRPFVWDWKLADLEDSLTRLEKGRDVERGKTLFAEAMCSRCHRLAGAGTAFGPDLDGAGARLSRRDLVETIIAPSKFVDEKYRDTVLATRDGQVLVGRLLAAGDGTLTVAVDPLDASRLVTVARDDVELQSASLLSSMPAGLLNTLTKEEILDLLAYLISEGDRGQRLQAK